MSAPAIQRVSLLLLLCLACLLRWYDPGLVPYTYDDASQIGIARGIGGNPLDSSGNYPLLSGGTTLGVQRSALHAYGLAFFLGLGSAIEAAVWGVGALGVVAVALVYRLGSRIGGPWVGIWSAAFMAVNPWLIYHDRRLWAHISTLVSVWLLYLAWRVVVDRRARAALWLLPALALQTLAHTLGVVQALSAVGAFLALPQAWLTRTTVYGALLALLLVAPYGWALAQAQPQLFNGNALSSLREDAADDATSGDLQGDLPENGTGQNPGQNPGQNTVQNSVQTTNLGVNLAPKWRNLLRSNHWTLLNHLATGTGYSSTIGREETLHFWWQAGLVVGVPIMWLFLGVGLLRLGFDLLHPLRGTGARLLLLWAALPMLLLGVQPVRIAFQYWTVLLPLPALLAALGVDGLRAGVVGWLPRANVGRALAWLPIAGGLVILGIWLGSYTTVHHLRSAGEAGTPLRFWRSGIQQAEAAAAQAETEEIRFAVSGIDPAFDGEAAAVATLIGNPPYARFVAQPHTPDEPPALLLNYTRPSLYYWTIDAPAAEANLDQWGTRIWQGDPRQGEPAARLYRLPAFVDLALPTAPLSDTPPFDVGLQLLAVDFPSSPQAHVAQTYTLIWRVLDPPWEVRIRDFTAYNHIVDDTGVDDTGVVVGQVDGLALLSRDWWPDDVLVQSYQMALPPGDLVWRAGFYSRVDGERAYTPDWADAVEIPLHVEP